MSKVSPACKVFEYEGDFYGQRAWFKVTSCAGGSLRAKSQLPALMRSGSFEVMSIPLIFHQNTTTGTEWIL